MNKHFFNLVVAIGFCLLATTAAQADLVYIVDQDGYAESQGRSASEGVLLAQSFIPSVDTIDAVGLFRYTYPGTEITVEIRDDNSGQPSDTVLGVGV